MRSDGLVLRVGTTETTPDAAGRLAAAIVREELPGQWIVTAMSRESRDFTVRRAAKSRNPTVAQAFDFANRLRRNRDVEDCEAALLLPVEGPPEMQPVEAARERRIGRASRTSGVASSSNDSSSDSSSSGDEIHLACSTDPAWALDLCSIRSAWALPPTAGGRSRGEGILIGHPDTGYTSHHEVHDPARLLTGRGFDFEDNDMDPRDPLTGQSAGHGTSTSSVIMSGESGDVVGAAPRAQLIPVRVTDSVVLFSFAKLASAIRFAADNGVHVISISLGGPFGSRFLERAVQHAVGRGVIVISAAGNKWPFVVHPARLDEVVAVAACNCRRRIWSASASGGDVDITAPGESVWRARATTAGFDVGRSSGTSYSTALVAGAASLWLAHHGRPALIARYGLSNVPRVFKELLTRFGFDRVTGWDSANYGPGILNARKLLLAALPVSPMAAGFRALRATAAPRSTNQLDRLLELFPAAAADDVRAGLARVLQVRPASLNLALRDVGDEVAYHAVTNPGFRRLIGRSATGQPRRPARNRVRRAASVAASTPTRAPTMPVLSRELRAMTGSLNDS